MRNRSLLLCSAALCLAAGMAQAQEAGFLESKMAWSVTKIDGAGGQSPYCAMAKRYGQNIILTMARNPKQEISLAMDFQAPKFNMSQSFGITLDPGAGQERNYNIQPVSSKAFVIRLGNDGAFMDALKRTGYLRVEIDQETYSFNLSDIGAGEMKLEACIGNAVVAQQAGAKPPAVPVSPVQSAPVGTASQDSEVSRQISDLRKDIQSLAQKNADLTDRLQTSAQEAQAINPPPVPSAPPPVPQAVPAPVSEGRAPSSSYAAPSGPPVPASSSVAVAASPLPPPAPSKRDVKPIGEAAPSPISGALTERLESLEAENAALRGNLQNVQAKLAAQGAAAGALDDLKGRIESLRAENDSLSQALKAGADSAALNESKTKSELISLKTENEKMAQALQSSQSNVTLLDDLKIRLASLQAQNKTLSDKIAENGRQQIDAQARDAKITSLESENKALQAQLGQSQAQLASMRQDVNGKDQAANTLITSLKSENTRLKDSLDGQKEAADSYQAAQAALEKLQAENASLKDNIDQVSQYKKDSASQLADLAQENGRLKAQIKQMQIVSSVAASTAPPVAAIPAPARASSRASTQAAQPATSVALEDSKLLAAAQASVMRDAEAETENADETDIKTEIEAGPVDITEAQKQEAMMKKSLPAPSSKGQEALSVRHAEDPYAAIDAANNVTGFESSGDGVIRLKSSKPSASTSGAPRDAESLNQESFKTAVASPAPGPVEAKILGKPDVPDTPSAQDAPDEEQRQSKDLERIASRARQAGFDRPVSPPPQSAQSAAVYAPGYSVASLLDKAGVVPGAQVEMVKDATGPAKISYQWQAQGVFGSAVQQPLSDPAAFDQAVKSYLEETELRCPGSFAVTPDDTADAEAGRVDTYEIACVGAKVNSSASLLFFSRNGTFTALAHEAPTTSLNAAMDVRDRLVKEVSGT